MIDDILTRIRREEKSLWILEMMIKLTLTPYQSFDKHDVVTLYEQRSTVDNLLQSVWSLSPISLERPSLYRASTTSIKKDSDSILKIYKTQRHHMWFWQRLVIRRNALVNESEFPFLAWYHWSSNIQPAEASANFRKISRRPQIGDIPIENCKSSNRRPMPVSLRPNSNDCFKFKDNP